MSQIEHDLRSVLAREPEIEKCYRKGLINRRALARYLVASGMARRDQVDAVVATIRRYDFGAREEPGTELFREIRVSVRDRILILDFERGKELLRRLERWIGQIDYDRGDTLKIVVGSSSVRLFIDAAKERALKSLFDRFPVRHRYEGISEISLLFPEEAIETRNILSVLTRELSLHDIVITELLTASPELLIYLADAHVPKAFELIRGLQAPPSSRPPRPAGARSPRSPGEG